MSLPVQEQQTTHAGLMDAVYRRQKYIYDATRKYYLLGRDRMIESLNVPTGGSILEVGCGTGRNLILAGQKWPRATLAGFDISAQMLETARKSVAQHLPNRTVTLALGDATNFKPELLFGVESFDRVFISYSLSMIPDWTRAAEAALLAVKPGGQLHIVDFGDQAGLPSWFRIFLRRWLAIFHVAPRLDMREQLQSLAYHHGAVLKFTPHYRGYTWSAVLLR